MSVFKKEPKFDQEPDAKGPLAITTSIAALLVAGAILIVKGLS